MHKKWLKYLVFLGIIVVCVGCDQHTKSLAKEQLSYSAPISYLDGFFTLIYAENTGAFLGLGESLHPNLKYFFLVFLPTLVLFLFAATYFKASSSMAQFVGMSLIVAGGIGNLIDRVTQGMVIDFMNIGIGEVRTGIFNFADVAVTTGLLLLIYTIYSSSKK